jgi:lipoyl(octanoyl) transferase
MIYPLIDIRRARIGVRELVTALEQSVVDVVAEFGITAVAKPEAPGVYVDGAKLASVGLRIRRGASFHGMALNVDADLEPFSRINPCGFEGLEMTDLRRLGIGLSLQEAADRFLPHFLRRLGLGDVDA